MILDEAHLSAAFEATLEAVARHRRETERPLAPTFALTILTATPRSELLRDGARIFGLTKEERVTDRVYRAIR